MDQIRLYQESDAAQLEAMIARQGEAYGETFHFPRIDDPQLALKLVLEADDGTLRMALLAKRTLNATLIVDPIQRETLRRRWEMFVGMNAIGEEVAKHLGYTEALGFLTHRVGETYSRHLRHAGWSHYDGPVFVKEFLHAR